MGYNEPWEIQGIERDAYYLYNPIIVKIKKADGDVTLKVTSQGKEYLFKLYPLYGSEIVFDLSKIVKDIIPEVKNNPLYAFPFGQSIVFDGAYKLNLTFAGHFEQEIFTKTFVLGGKKDYSKNLPVVKNNLNLNYDKWENKYAFDFKLIDDEIVGEPIMEANQRKRVNCDDAYLFFRNHKGGFSGYLFEDFDIKESGRDLGYYITMDNIIDSGIELMKELTVRTKAKREHYEVMNDLSVSKEIYLVRSSSLTRIIGGNNFVINDKLPVTDVEMTFEIAHNYHSQ